MAKRLRKKHRGIIPGLEPGRFFTFHGPRLSRRNIWILEHVHRKGRYSYRFKLIARPGAETSAEEGIGATVTFTRKYLPEFSVTPVTAAEISSVCVIDSQKIWLLLVAERERLLGQNSL